MNTLKTEFNASNQKPDSLVRLAKGFQQSGDLVSALNFYGQASAANPKLLEPWLGIIGVLREFDNPVGTRAAIRDATIHHPNDPDLILVAAEVEIADDKAADAISILAPYLNRKDYRFANLLGVASEMIGSPTVARNYYSNALAYNGTATGITDNLALSFSFYNDHKTAINILQKNLNNADSRNVSYETLAIIYAMDNQLDAALNIARESLTDEETSDNYLFYKALATLSPVMRARAVFTRTIPKDASPQPLVTSQTTVQQSLTRAEMARQLVNLHDKESSDEQQIPAPEPRPKPIAQKADSQAEESLGPDDTAKEDTPAVQTQTTQGNSAEQQQIEPKVDIPATQADDLQPAADSTDIDTEEQPETETAPQAAIKIDTRAADAETPTASRPEKAETTPEATDALDAIVKEALPDARLAYRVQIAAVTSIIDAQREWCRIAKRVEAAGITDSPNVRVIGEGDGTRYRLLLGEYDERADANTTCESLQANKFGCYVVKGAGQLIPLEIECNK